MNKHLSHDEVQSRKAAFHAEQMAKVREPLREYCVTVTATTPAWYETKPETFAVVARTRKDAIRLMGAAKALRERINLAMMQVERSEYDQLVSILREQMDESAFQKVWNEGRALTTEQAIELALNTRQET